MVEKMEKVRKISLGPETKIPTKIFREMGITKKEKFTLITGKKGFILLRDSLTLTDMLTGLVKTKNKEWDKSEYLEYLASR